MLLMTLGPFSKKLNYFLFKNIKVTSHNEVFLRKWNRALLFSGTKLLLIIFYFPSLWKILLDSDQNKNNYWESFNYSLTVKGWPWLRMKYKDSNWENFTKNDFNINFYSIIKHIIKHLCSNVFRDSIRIFFLDLSLKIPGKNFGLVLQISCVRNYTKLKLRKLLLILFVNY